MSDPANWYEWIKVSAFVVGLVFGGFAVGSPSWVWLRKQLLPAIAGWLATLGTILISMSIWQSVEIEGPGLKLRISELSDAIALQSAVIEANAALTLAAPPRFGGRIDAAATDEPDDPAYKDYLAKLAAFLEALEKLEAAEKRKSSILEELKLKLKFLPRSSQGGN